MLKWGSIAYARCGLAVAFEKTFVDQKIMDWADRNYYEYPDQEQLARIHIAAAVARRVESEEPCHIRRSDGSVFTVIL